MAQETLTGGAADVERIRAAFPALERRERGLPVAYFDGPGGTQVPKAVVSAMEEYLLRHNANTHWNYPSSAETDEALAGARATFADFMNASPAEIAFGANMTTLTFHLARGLGAGWGPGDEIVVTELDHHANIDPWRAIGRERGVTVRMARLDPSTGQLDAGDFEQSVGPRTRLLAIGGASNALGTVNDLRRAVSLARAAGALVFVDAVHSAPHLLPDVRALDCDFLACSAYKFYGPHVGVLYARRRLIESVDIPKLEPAPDEAPERIETGTLNHEGIVGAAAAVDFLASLGQAPGRSRRGALESAYAGLHERGQRLFALLWAGLRAIPSVTLYGPPPEAPRTPTVSFVVAGKPAADVARALAARAVFVSDGDFYATTAIARLGHARDGVVRAGCAAYTTEEEVERLLEAVRVAAAA